VTGGSTGGLVKSEQVHLLCPGVYLD